MISVEITNVIDSPVAVADQFAVVGANATLLPILDNDRNPDGSLDEVTIEIIADPTQGSLTVVNMQVRFTPSPTAEPGSDTFSYRLTSSGGNSGTVAVSLFLVSAERPWHNPVNRYDVNADGTVSPLDALSVINHIGDNLTYPSNLEGLELGPPPFVDVDGDGNSSPLDALLVINQLTGGSAASSAAASSASVSDVRKDREYLPTSAIADFSPLTRTNVPRRQQDKSLPSRPALIDRVFGSETL